MSNFTKVYNRRTKKEINYAKSKDVLEELNILEMQKGWTIFSALKVLQEGKADSFSFTKDHPYQYFYARMTDKFVVIKLKTSDRVTEFEIPRSLLIML